MFDASRYPPGFNPPPLVDQSDPFKPEPKLDADSTTCDHCGELLEIGDPCVEIFPGILGRGKRNKTLMCVDEDSKKPGEVYILHVLCVKEFFEPEHDAMMDGVDDTCHTCGEVKVCPNCDDIRCVHCDVKLS